MQRGERDEKEALKRLFNYLRDKEKLIHSYSAIEVDDKRKSVSCILYASSEQEMYEVKGILQLLQADIGVSKSEEALTRASDKKKFWPYTCVINIPLEKIPSIALYIENERENKRKKNLARLERNENKKHSQGSEKQKITSQAKISLEELFLQMKYEGLILNVPDIDVTRDGSITFELYVSNDSKDLNSVLLSALLNNQLFQKTLSPHPAIARTSDNKTFWWPKKITILPENISSITPFCKEIVEKPNEIIGKLYNFLQKYAGIVNDADFNDKGQGFFGKKPPANIIELRRILEPIRSREIQNNAEGAPLIDKIYAETRKQIKEAASSDKKLRAPSVVSLYQDMHNEIMKLDLEIDSLRNLIMPTPPSNFRKW